MSYLSSNPYVLNLVPLFDVANNVGGSLTTSDSNIANLQTMVNYDTKGLLANSLQAFDTGSIVDMTGSFAVTGELLVNGVQVGPNLVGGNSVAGNTFQVELGGTALNMYSTAVNSVNIEFITGGNSVLQIDDLGRVLYQGDGSNSNVNRLWVSSSVLHADRAAINLGGISTMSTIFDVWNGDAYFDGNVNVAGDVICNQVYTFSDERLKSNIRPLGSALSTICALQGVWYDMGGKPSLGFIAQDVDKVISEAVCKSDPERWAVDYSKIVPVLVEAIKELVKA